MTDPSCVNDSEKHPEDMSQMVHLVDPLPCRCGQLTTQALIWPEDGNGYRFVVTCPSCYRAYQADLARDYGSASTVARAGTAAESDLDPAWNQQPPG